MKYIELCRDLDPEANVKPVSTAWFLSAMRSTSPRTFQVMWKVASNDWSSGLADFYIYI
jgi:hypothetical protein